MRVILAIAVVAGGLLAEARAEAQVQQPVAAAPGDEVQLGARAGVGLAWVAGGDVDSEVVESTHGFTVGASLLYRAAPWLGLQAELLYVSKGFRTKPQPYWALDFMITTKTSVGYVTAPLLVRADLPTGGRLRPYIYAGPQVGVNVMAEGERTVTSTNYEIIGATTKSEDISDQVTDVELAFDAGVGAELRVGRETRIFLDLRYERGLTSIDDTATGTDVKNHAMALAGGVLF